MPTWLLMVAEPRPDEAAAAETPQGAFKAAAADADSRSRPATRCCFFAVQYFRQHRPLVILEPVSNGVW